MSNLERRLQEDRAMRDAAKQNFLADIAHTRAALSGSGIANRVAGRVGEGARDVFETAKEQADDNRGIVAALIGALVLWLGRGPLLELLNLNGDHGEEEDVFDRPPSDTGPQHINEHYPDGEYDDDRNER